MKTIRLILCLFCMAPAVFGADATLQSKPTATSPAGDDWLLLQGATNGQRKLSPLYYQPLNSNLTAIGVLSQTTYGRAVTTLADAAAGRTYFGVVIGTNVEAWSANLDAWSAISTSSKAAASHTHALSDLTASGATANQVPRWNGTAWVPVTISAGGGDAFLAGPQTFTGIHSFPTAAVDTNTTQAATTAFVLAQAAAATPLIDGTAAVGTSTRFARADHVHPTDTSRAASTHTHAESDVTGLVADLAAKALKSQVVPLATFVFDGQGSVVTSGTSTSSKTIPAAATITGYAIEADQSASGVVDVLMATGTGSFSSIAASAKPTLTSQVWVDSSVLTSWTVSLAAKARLKGTITGTVSGTKFTVVVYGTLN